MLCVLHGDAQKHMMLQIDGNHMTKTTEVSRNYFGADF